MYVWNDGTDVLMHHGIKGQKWGRRRFQNPDMTYTAAGKERYSWASRMGSSVKAKAHQVSNKVKNFKLSEGQKKALKIGATVAATVLVAYGAYKLGTSPQFKEFVKKGETIYADMLETHDIKKRIFDEMRMEVSDKYGKAAMDIDRYTSDKLDQLYKQMEKVESLRTKENNAEVNQLIAELYDTRKSIISDRNNALKDFRRSYMIEGTGLNVLKMMNMPANKLMNRMINEGKNVVKFDERKITDLIRGENYLYDQIKSLGDDPTKYGIAYRKSRIV